MSRLPRPWRAALGLTGVAACAMAAAAWWLHAEAQGLAQAGEALFEGRELADPAPAPVLARLQGHALNLPPGAWRCANCHDPAPGPARPSPAAASVPSGLSRPGLYARPLDRAHLSETLPRRGGPPTRYDETALCALLRTGVDPARVMIDTTMPRYELTDLQCRQLWRYLLTR